VLEWAAAEGRVLITLDKDFGDFLFLERIRHAGIIRLPDVPAAKRIGMVKTILEQHGHQLGPQTVVTASLARIRITRSPCE
jgi:predicted nuclease of predicted toxin-antitoxin system